MVTNFDIPLRTYQTLLRSLTGGEIKKIVGYNPFVEMESTFQLRYKSLSEKLGLDFIEWQGTVTGVVDIRKTLAWYLSSKCVADLLKIPNNAILASLLVPRFMSMAVL